MKRKKNSEKLVLSPSIWTDRPLFLLCTLFIIGCVFGFFSLFEIKIFSAVLSFALAVAVLILMLIKKSLRTRTFRLIALGGLAFCLSMLLTHYVFDVRYSKYNELGAQMKTMEATVIAQKSSSESLSSFDIEITGMEDADSSLFPARARLDCRYVADLQVGDMVRVRGTVLPIKYYASEILSEISLIGEDYSFAVISYVDKDIEYLGEDGGIRFKLARLNVYLGNKLADGIGGDEGGLATALLLGNKSLLSPETERNYSRTGMSHILALSGMHFTILFGILDMLLRLFWIPKKVRIPLLATGSLFYLALVGFIPSATRAVVMLFFTYLAYALSEDCDSVTSLGVAAVLILLLSPTAVCDKGFWLSFFATLGIVLVMPPLSERLDGVATSFKRHRHSLIGRVFDAVRTKTLVSLINIFVGLIVGVAAMTMTIWLIAMFGGCVSILSPITTLLLSPLSGIFLGGSVFYLICAGSPIGNATALFLKDVGAMMNHITSELSEDTWHIFSTVLWVIPLLSVLSLAVAFIPLPCKRYKLAKKKFPNKRLFIAPAVGIAAICVCVGADMYINRNTVTMSYGISSSESEYIVMTHGKEAVICDFSNGSNSSFNMATYEASDMGAVDISVFMITDYHSRTPGSLSVILAKNMVRQLWLPQPQNDDEYNKMLSCLEKAAMAEPAINVKIYSYGEALTTPCEIEMTLHREDIERSVKPVLRLDIDTDISSVTYCSPVIYELGGDLLLDTERRIRESDTVIFANAGPKIKHRYDITDAVADTRPYDIVFTSESTAVHAILPTSQKINLILGRYRGKIYLK